VVWNTTENPTVDSYLGKTDEGTGTTAFTSTLSGLHDTTTYYVRAYAVNSNGTVYGGEKSFTTLMAAPPP
jgi:GH43 family beta-xylosidase